MAERLRSYALAALPVVVYLGLVRPMMYVQDDAFITLAYGRNLVQGLGPVFNAGEYVEGFTSLLWMLISAIAVAVSASPMDVMQGLGVIGACVTLILTYQTTTVLLRGVGSIWRYVLASVAATWLAASSAFQFWSASGMEVTLFTTVIMATIYAFITRRDGMQWVWLGALALLTRPEAMLVVGMLVMYRLVDVVQRRQFRAPWSQLAVLGATMAMLEGWRWVTYGALLPNTFSAKTTTLDVQVADGITYLWQWLVHMMAYGSVLLLAVLGVARTRSRESIEVMSLALVWALAVMLLGGDVLRHQRFLLPVGMLIAPFIALGAVRGMQMLALRNNTRMMVASAAIVAFAAHGVLSERSAIERTMYFEGELVDKMRSTGLFLRNVATKEGRRLTVAASTIGALKWWSEQTVVDMLGLTDRTIATQPVRIPEVSEDSSIAWKERNYNADYILQRAPDFIVFSTGMKPSAFAERALFARQFYVEYYQYYYPLGTSTALGIMYRRKPKVVLERSPQRRIDLTSSSIRTLNDYARAIQLLSSADGRADAEMMFKRVTAEGPSNFSGAWQQLSDIARDRGDYETMYDCAQRAIIIDPCDIRAHFALFQYYRNVRDSTNTILHGDWIARCNPILFRELNIPVPEGSY